MTARRTPNRRYRKKHINKGIAVFMTLLLTCALVLFFSFDLENGSIHGTLFSDAKSVIDDSNKAEELRDARVDNYYQYIEFLREEARIAAAKAEAERLEQERIAAAKAEAERLEQERIAAEQARIEAERAAEQARIEAEKAAEQERLMAELAAEQERLAREQRVKEYVTAVAHGEQTSDAMSGITFRRNKNVVGKVALTFDDGPFKSYTYDYLDILEEYGVKTTFFCQVIYVERYPDQLQAIVDAGHEIGCHSYAHAQLNKLSSAALQDEIDKCKEILDPFQEITLFRYPYGAYNDRTNGILKENNLISVMWSVDPEDWAKSNSQDVIDHILKNTKDGDIILLHEGKKVTLEALPGIITGLRDMGFEIVTVSELLYGDMDELPVEEEVQPEDEAAGGAEETTQTPTTE